jgi:NADH-quinone oxidoreductase subunit J
VAQAAQAAGQFSNTKELGRLLYTEYLFPLEIAAVILLVAIVAAVALTLRRRKDIKYFDPASAVKVKSTDRLKIVKLQPESARTSAPSASMPANPEQ